MSDASSLIKARINSSYIGTNAYISLKNIRDINVLVVGNAFNPGQMPPQMSGQMANAMPLQGMPDAQMAAGMPVDNGNKVPGSTKTTIPRKKGRKA